MRRFALAAALALLSLLAPNPPARAAMPITYNWAPSDLGISAATLSSAPCATIRVGSLNTVTWYVNLTRVAATTLTLTCSAGPGAALLAPVPIATVSSTVSLTQPSPTFTYPSVSASGLYSYIVQPVAHDYLKCCVGGAGATSDTVSAYARGIGQQ
jgi:hypothetical protein